MQTHTLIQTKLQPPTLDPNILPRRQLIERVENGRFRQLTLISAPAGYGKSVLASLWQKECACPTAWISLDKNDNQLGRFLSYFTAAVRTIFPDGLEKTTALLNAPQLPPLETITAILINETAVLPHSFVIILDDFHLITLPKIHQLLAALIQHQSDKMHLMLITREDPLFGLPRLRARNQVTEIRAKDLRFNQAEAAQFLRQNQETPIPDDLVATLADRTEGWPAGLRLTRLALRAHGETAVLQERLHSGNHYITSYLLDEVLGQQPPAIQNFLLRTAVLDRFCPALCDFLQEEDDASGPFVPSREILDTLVQTNLFTFSLDPHGEWFRYHHLFQELLLIRSRAALSPFQLAALHKKAGRWYADHGYTEEALEHYLQAQDVDTAVRLIAAQRYHLMNAARWQRVNHLLNYFSPQTIAQYPDLLIIKVWLMYYLGQWGELAPDIQKLEALAVTIQSAGKLNYFRAEISTLHALLSYLALKPEQTIEQAQFAIENTPPELWIVRVLARTCLAGAQFTLGNLSGAYGVIYGGLAEEKEQSDHFKATLIQTACFIHWMAADLIGMIQAARQADKLSQNSNISIRGFAHYHLGAALYQQNDLSGAENAFLFVVQEPYLHYGENYIHSAIGLALTYQAQGKPEMGSRTAEALVEYLLDTGNVSDLALAQAFQAELALRHHSTAKAYQWAAQFDEPPPLMPAFRQFLPHFTLVKVWLAQKTPASLQQAANLLDTLKAFFTFSHNTRYLLEVLALQALLYAAQNKEEKSQTALVEALLLAQPGGVVRVFVDLGDEMANLLSNLAAADDLLAYCAQLLAAFTTAGTGAVTANWQYADFEPIPTEPFTNRELDILDLLAKRYSDKEIAERLFISVNTVRYHNKNIYSKLKVNGRREAVIRVQNLDPGQ